MKPISLSLPAALRCEITLPASKSISNRALVINALSGNGCAPQNVSDCDDTRVMVRALQDDPHVIDIMAAGTAMRFLSAYLSVTPGDHVITGTERMQHRPIAILVDALRHLGAHIEYVGQEGFPPLHIRGGKHRGGHLSLPGDVSSQYISALLMTGPTLQDGLRLTLTGQVVSRPYIDMTLQIMRQFGAQAQWTAPNEIEVLPHPYQPIPYYIENDWSAASYWYEMVALSPDAQACVTLPGLFAQSLQGDAAVSDIFAHLGVATEYHTDAQGLQGVTLRKGSQPVDRLELDMVCQPDLAQTVVVTCAMMGIPFRLTGLQSLKIKETDRIHALRTELAKLGYQISEAQDSILLWDGQRCPAQQHPAIDTYEDHRMAMAFAPCCLRVPSLTINDPQVVSKSYPGYWDDLRSAGFTLSQE